MKFLTTWLASALSVGVAIWLVPGIEVVGGGYAAPIFTALFLSLINASIKPFLSVLSLPLTVVSLGFFQLVINAFMLELASYLSRNITHAGILIESFSAAFIGAIVIAIASSVVGSIVRS